MEACLALCAECFLSCIEGLVEYFNRYAYIEIGRQRSLLTIAARPRVPADPHSSLPALYGKPYLSAAKDTWRLFKDRGIDAIINDSLVGMSACVAFLRGMVL